MFWFDLWSWGLVASAIVNLPVSLFTLRHVNKYDKDFKEYLKNRNPLLNIGHFAWSTAKCLIPVINLIYPCYLFTKLCRMGIAGLENKWKTKIENRDSRRENVKNWFTKVNNKLFNRSKVENKKLEENNSKVETKEIKSENVKEEKEISKENNVLNIDEAMEEKPKKIKIEENKVENTTSVAKDNYQELAERFDRLNNSNKSTKRLLKFYTKEYWNVREEYDELKKEGKSTLDAYNRLLIIYNKCDELKQMRDVELIYDDEQKKLIIK